MDSLWVDVGGLGLRLLLRVSVGVVAPQSVHSMPPMPPMPSALALVLVLVVEMGGFSYVYEGEWSRVHSWLHSWFRMEKGVNDLGSRLGCCTT
jgi:hypothetical protein